ncbi:hypothetical protein AgCh_019622 [Apium graveolens]
MLLKKKSNKSGNEQTARSVKNLDEWHDALEENAFSAMPTKIRAMFVNILANYFVSGPLALWEKYWPALSDDILYIRRKISDNIHLTLSEYEIQNYALAEIEKLLNDVGKSLRDFHMMSFPDERFFHTFINRLIVEETSYNIEELRLNHEKAHKNLNSRQLDVYNAVVDNILPVLPKAGRVEIVNAPFNKYWIWKSCKNLAEMEALMFEHILSLDKSRSDWKIKARVTRMWPTVSSESGITKGWNLILLDDDVTT